MTFGRVLASIWEPCGGDFEHFSRPREPAEPKRRVAWKLIKNPPAHRASAFRVSSSQILDQ